MPGRTGPKARHGPSRCAAREIARFVAQHGELPNTFLGDYLVGRCGSASLRASLAVRAFEVTGYDEARLAREATARVVAQRYAGNDLDVGLAFETLTSESARCLYRFVQKRILHDRVAGLRD